MVKSNVVTGGKISPKAEEYFTNNPGDSTANERAVIIKNGFSLDVNRDGHFMLTSPVIRKANKGKGKAGIYTGGNLTSLEVTAVGDLKAYQTANPVPEAAPEVTPEPVAEVTQDPVSKPEVTPEPVTASDNVVPITKRAKLTDKLIDPPAEISGDDIELDNTGKSEKPPKKEKAAKPPREPKANRYGRTAVLMLANPDIKPEEVAKQASMSLPMAVYCIEAFRGITSVLIEQKLYKELPVPQAAK